MEEGAVYFVREDYNITGFGEVDERLEDGFWYCGAGWRRI